MKKVVLITGGTRGIGEAIVKKFARNGYDICFSYAKSKDRALKLEQQCQQEYNVKIISVQADAANPIEIKNLINKCLQAFGKIDVLVNNVGISQSKLLIDMNDQEIFDMINTNLNSCIFTTREVAKHMMSNMYGKIVNISSMWGVSGASMESVYSASKAGIIGFTKAMAKELGLMNINVNAIAPGCIDTDMMKCYSKKEIKELEENTILGRIGKPDEIANIVYFLSSEDSSFITGQTISADGGFLN